ncbi:MAG: universal stress protein [Chloroflexi bacterium]|nr:universal stress protein [Chloroflexota bacterium]
MYRHILVAVDGSASSRRALDLALALAQALNAKLSLVSVEEELPHFPGEVGELKEEKQRQNEYCRRIQREAHETAKLRGILFASADILTGHATRRIVEHARAVGCDLVVLGHSGRSGAWANLLGNTAERVSRHAHCSVLIVR